MQASTSLGSACRTQLAGRTTQQRRKNACGTNPHMHCWFARTGKRVVSGHRYPNARIALKPAKSGAVASAVVAEDKWLARTVKEVATPSRYAQIL